MPRPRAEFEDTRPFEFREPEEVLDADQFYTVSEIGRLLLIDKSTILVSSFTHHQSGDRNEEQAVFGRGFDNGLVAIVRRLMATGFREYDAAEVSE